MQLTNRIVLITEKIIAAIGKTAVWAIIPLMLIMVFEVVTRRMLNHPSVWTFETSIQLYGFHFMILGALTLQMGRHISVDIISDSGNGPATFAARDLPVLSKTAFCGEGGG